MKNNKYFLMSVLALALCTGAVRVQAAACSFDRDLELDDDGEDVRCLQQFLNTHGFSISDSGGGSPGHETTLFGGKTRDALMRWQTARGISPVSGLFGPLSRAAYVTEASGAGVAGASGASGATVADLQAQLQANLDTIKKLQADQDAKSAVTRDESDAKKALQKAEDLFNEADDSIDEAKHNGESVSGAENDFDDAKDDLLKALFSLVGGDFAKAKFSAENAAETLNDVLDSTGGSKSDAQNAIDDAQDAVDNARDDIRSADRRGKDVDRAKDLLDNADNKLDDANNSFDDKDYRKALTLANKAEDLANEAVDAIGN